MYYRFNLDNSISFRDVELGRDPLICIPIVSLEKRIIKRLNNLKNEIKLIEIRFDYLYNQYKDIFEQINQIKIPYIFTFRSYIESDRGKNAIRIDDETRIKYYLKAIEQDASLIDFELSSIKINKNFYKLIEEAHRKNVGVIISYHNFQETPKPQVLFDKIDEENSYNADVLKIATMVKNLEDIITIDNVTFIARQKFRKPMMTMGMGQIGKLSRISAVAFGSDIIFAHLGKKSAPGQLSFSQAKKIIDYLYKGD